MDRRTLEEFIRTSDSNVFEPHDRFNESTFGACLGEINFHSKYRYFRYHPSSTGKPFMDRLCEWLSSAIEDHDRRAMLRLVSHIHYVDSDDLTALYVAAFDGPISRWIMDQTQIRFGPPKAFDAAFSKAVQGTWFCPVTDSLDIAQFHHINQLAGHADRSVWTTLTRYSEPAKIHESMTRRRVERLVLLEDFVGSGTQCCGVLDHALDNFPSVPILFVPLIASEAGIPKLRRRYDRFPTLTIEPVTIIPPHAHVRRDRCAREPEVFSVFRRLVHSTYPNLGQTPGGDTPEPFGFRDVGTLLVLATNCPNNTLPIIWHSSPNWHALFPRVDRVPPK